MDNNHISQERLLQFKQDQLSSNDSISFLEHISSCKYCSERFAECMMDDLIPAPFDMKNNILKATKRPEVQIARKINETSKRMQLLWYSLKVGTATIGALVVLTLVMHSGMGINANPDRKPVIPVQQNTDDNDNISLTAAIRDKMNNFSSSILDFSNNILNTEVNNHDQKEK